MEREVGREKVLRLGRSCLDSSGALSVGDGERVYASRSDLHEQLVLFQTIYGFCSFCVKSLLL